jgi:NADH:ubiquinone reductase (H+-translocating)
MKKTILILGGGFGGVYTAVHLKKQMTPAEKEAYDVVIVSHDNYLVFQPLLPEVISGSVGLNHVITPIRRLASSAQLYTREIEAIDLHSRVVRMSPGATPAPAMITYDYLVIALGTRLDPAQIPGMREHAIAFRYLADALYLRNQLVQVLEQADTEDDPQVREALLTFVVAGGGFSGVECIAEMNDYLREAIGSYRRIQEKDLKLILLQRGDRILPELTETLSSFAADLLMKRGVQVQLGSSVTAVTASSVQVKNLHGGQTRTIPTRTTVATVPAGPHPIIASLPIPKERGRINVDEGMAVVEAPGVWALGDCALVKQVDGDYSPPTAQHALRQAKTCAANILASIRKQPKETFTFTGLGKMGSLGRRCAVAEIFGFRLKGLFAWMLWRGVYATKFPGLDGQLRLMADWILDAFLPRDITQVRVFHEEGVHREHFEPGQIVFHAGDVGDKVYFITRGAAAVIQNGHVVAPLHEGEMFGEAALVCNHVRGASIRAETPLDVVVVNRDAFQDLLGNLPGLSDGVQRVMSERMGRTVNLSREVSDAIGEHSIM